MATKNPDSEKEEKKKRAEKPISLWGAPFTEVLGALLKTKPMPKEEKPNKKIKGQV